MIWPRLACGLGCTGIAVSTGWKRISEDYGPSVVMRRSCENQGRGRRRSCQGYSRSRLIRRCCENESTDMITHRTKGGCGGPSYAFSDPNSKTSFSMNPEIFQTWSVRMVRMSIIFKCENRYGSVVPQEKIDEIKGLLRSRAADEKLRLCQRSFEDWEKRPMWSTCWGPRIDASIPTPRRWSKSSDFARVGNR